MSAPEQHDYDGQRSRVKLIANTKGVFWEISVLAGEDEAVVTEAKRIAVAAHRAMEREFGLRPAEAA